MSLDKIGSNSLLAVNSWIGVINANLQSASRTGYKTTRIAFSDGLGINTVSDDFTLPPSTLSVQATKIEWGQGSIVNSTANTHFALQGEGFFVLHDSNSNKYYLSRDGEFHWGNEGYLVNSSGLKVVSAGQDYIRYGTGDASDIFSPDGYSRELNRYGNKSFMVVDVLNRDNLRMSKYGSTTFELDGNLTLRVKNDFNTTTDGITFVYDDPILIPVVDDPGFVTTINPPLVPNLDFSINFGPTNGTFTFAGFNPGVNTIPQVIAAINAYGAGLPPVNGLQAVQAVFDSDSDRLTLINRVTPGQDNSITWSGVNGEAMRKFFRVSNDNGVQDELSTPLYDENIVTSSRDIDNSHLVEFKDIDYALFPGPPTRPAIPLTTTFLGYVNPQPTYTHNVAGGFIESVAPGGNSMIIGEATATDEFDLVMDLKISDTGLLILGFGQNDPHSFHTGGFQIVYNPTAGALPLGTSPPFPFNLGSGQVVVRQMPTDYKAESFSVITGGPAQNVGAIGVAIGGLGAAATNRVAVRLDGNQQLTFSVNGNTASFDLGGSGENLSGYLTLRNSLNTMQLHSIYADYKRSANAVTTGEMVSVAYRDFANVEPGNTVYGSRPRTRVIQAALEASEASLTEYVPMLSLAQKLFSAISKIISIHNATVDDLNSLMR